MAPATRRTCQVAGCNLGEGGTPYQTQEGLATQESVLKDLELHLSMAHSRGHGPGGGGGGVRDAASDVKPDKFPQPVIDDPATDTDWLYFEASWSSYKRATRISGQSACDQLWYCPSESLRKKVFDSGIRLGPP